VNVMEAPRLLEGVEDEFVARVATHLRDLTPSLRRELVEEVRAHLRDRPPCCDEDALWTQLGTPTDYSVALREVHGLIRERVDWWARWLAVPRARRGVLLIVSALTIVMLLGGGLTLRWWLIWHADVQQVSASVTWAASNGVGDLSTADGITWQDSAHPSVRIDFSKHRDVVLEVVVLADRPPERVTLPFLEWLPGSSWSSLATVVSATIDPRRTDQGAVADRPVGDSYVLRIHLRGVCRSTKPNATSHGLGAVRLHYRALGRARYTDLDLDASVELSGVDETC
jgi:hypothetical protein